jgi:ribosomal protein L11 methyltransferase
VKSWPAVDVHQPRDADLLLAALDDYHPTAIEERGPDVRAFFSTTADRDAAGAALAGQFNLTSIEVSDEDWARRSQENLTPVTVGRITVLPHASLRLKPPFDFSQDRPQPAERPDPATTKEERIPIVIRPSMGFGTGHHATTRLCLEALQGCELRGRFVLDVGTGSGVLALAARRLGARDALGIDVDPDAIASARDNLADNPRIDGVRFEVRDLRDDTLPAADVITANLTGALLSRAARQLTAKLRDGGTLIVSGVQADERDQVFRTLSDAAPVWEREEDGWVGARFNRAALRRVSQR